MKLYTAAGSSEGSHTMLLGVRRIKYYSVEYTINCQNNVKITTISTKIRLGLAWICLAKGVGWWSGSPHN